MEHTNITQTPDILDEIDQVIYIADMDTYELLFVNKTGRELLGCGNEYRGKKCFEVLQGRESVCPFCRNDCLTNNGETCKWDHYNDNIGVYFQLQDRQITYSGHRARIEMAINISERENRNRDLKNALAEQSLLSECARILNGNSDIKERVDQVMSAVGKHYRADRAYIFSITDDGQKVRNTFEWCNAGIMPEIENLQDIDMHYIDRWRPSFLRREAVVEPDIENIGNSYPDEYKIMAEQGIRSYMEAPLFSEEKLFGFLGVDNPDSSMIENSSATIMTMAYAISNALVRDAGQKQAQASYEHSFQEMMVAVPNAVGILRFNLTKNTCTAIANERSFFGIEERRGVWNWLVERMSANIPDTEERMKFQGFRTTELLKLFNSGSDRYQMNYRYAGADEKIHFIMTCLRMVLNPDTNEVEGVAYSLDLSNEERQNEIFRIITDRSFDLVALINLKSGTFEAVFLGESLPDEYRKYLPKRGAVCDFRDFCAESVLYMDKETKDDYMPRLSPEYMRKELDENGGTYEFTLKESFPSRKNQVMYRKFLHYRLDSDPDTILVIESDETEATVHQQEELKHARDEAEHDRMIMDSVLGGISVLRMDKDRNLSIRYFNSYVFRMLGYDPVGIPQRMEEAKGTMFEPMFADALTFIHSDDRERVKNAFIENINEESFSLKPYRMFGKGNKCYWILERVRVVSSADGERVFYAAFHDVSDEIELQAKVEHQLQTEQQLRRKADLASAAKTDFLSRISHDMRTPLNGVIGMAYLANEQDNPPYTAECLAKINTSAKFLLGLINNILDMSKVESGKIELHPEPYTIQEFNDYLDAVIRPLCEEKNQKFILDADINIYRIPLSDKNCINQVFFNLLSNAVKFTPEGGTITYRIVGRQIAGERVAIEHWISDTGIGISREFQERLFEPFSQEGRDDSSECRGSGLGLSIVKKFVDLMGGTVSVQSEIGHGTTFLLKFEFDTVSADENMQPGNRTQKVSPETISLAGRHILLCEDHPLNQEIAESILSEKGMLVDIVENGELGVKRFSTSSIRYYDAILMDIRMPVMDGYEATKAIRALNRVDAETVPIIAMTADAFTDDIKKCLAEGMNAHVAKPIDPDKLCRTIESAMAKKKT